jgi:glycosyltransferase involved in cell wall biosynthesis
LRGRVNRVIRGFRTAAVAVGLWAQRHKMPIPKAARGPLRAIVAWAGDRGSLEAVNEWSQPLVRGRGGDITGLPPEPDEMCPVGSVRRVDESTIESTSVASRDRIRCVVATGVLDVGGMAEFVGFLGRRLPSLGVDTTVIYSDTVPPGYRGAGGRLANDLRSHGVPTFEVSEGEAREWLAFHHPDVMSAHGAPPWLVSDAVEAGIPVVETLHRSLLERDSWAQERIRSRQIACFVAVSELTRAQYLLANPEYPAERVVTIPNGVEHDQMDRCDRAQARAWLGLQDEFLFVSLARYCVQKNPFGLVSAFSDVANSHPEAHLLVAGRADDPVLFEQVRRLRDGLPCADQIHLRGHCPDVPAVLAAADGFVLDSFFEGWPLASMEALISGLPVVMSEVAGAREQLGDDGARGFIVPNPLGDPAAAAWRSMGNAFLQPQSNRAALAAAMSAIIQDRKRWAARRDELGAESIERFSSDTCLRRHAQVLLNVATGAPARSSDGRHGHNA